MKKNNDNVFILTRLFFSQPFTGRIVKKKTYLLFTKQSLYRLKIRRNTPIEIKRVWSVIKNGRWHLTYFHSLFEFLSNCHLWRKLITAFGGSYSSLSLFRITTKKCFWARLHFSCLDNFFHFRIEFPLIVLFGSSLELVVDVPPLLRPDHEKKTNGGGLNAAVGKHDVSFDRD